MLSRCWVPRAPSKETVSAVSSYDAILKQWYLSSNYLEKRINNVRVGIGVQFGLSWECRV